MSSTVDTSLYTSTTTSASDLAAVAAARRSSSSSSLSDSLDFDDYLTLMVAQLQNQDMYNTTDTSEMTSQLAQYSLVTAAEQVLQMQNTNYAATLIGKQVTASYEDSAGKLVTNTGTVTGVTLYEGEPLVYVNGIPYNLGEIMIIGTTDSSSGESTSTDSTDQTSSDKVDAADKAETETKSSDEAVNSTDDEAAGNISDVEASESGIINGAEPEDEVSSSYTDDSEEEDNSASAEL
jgi:flagellar basal-body rod modification protein FlgD